MVRRFSLALICAASAAAVCAQEQPDPRTLIPSHTLSVMAQRIDVIAQR